MQIIDKTLSPRAGIIVIMSLGENNKQEVERQIWKAISENRSGDNCVEEDPLESRDGSSEKEPKKQRRHV